MYVHAQKDSSRNLGVQSKEPLFLTVFRNVDMKYDKKYAKNCLFIFICTWHDHKIKDGKPKNASCTHKYIVD